MARERRAGIGCGGVAFVVLLVLVAALAAAWLLGGIDRLIYLFQIEAGRTAATQQVEPAAAETARWYVYEQLSADDQERYLILLDAFQSREGRAYPETDMDDLARMRDCVLADHPELFSIGGIEMQTTSNLGSGLVTGLTVEGQYLYSAEEAAALQPQIDAAADACLAGMPDGDDYAKAKYLYEYLAENVEYDHGDWGEGSAGQTIADVLVGRRAVCAGYARTFQYLMQRAGVTCVYVTGTANGGSHAWCAAFLDGNWYFVDPTWGDPQFLDEGGAAADFGRVNYDYLCVTGDDIAATHVADCPYPLPACVSDADNYFVREGLVVTDSDLEWAGHLIEAAVARGDSSARFRCDTRATYDYLVASLFEGQEVYRFIPGTSCRYLLDDAMRTIEIIFA